MSDHQDQDLDRLDERARLASADLHSRATVRPVPTFDPSHSPLAEAPVAPRIPQSRRRLLAVAAAVLVVAAVAGIVISRSGHDDEDKAGVITTDPRPFVAGTLPDGFTLSGAGEIDPADVDSSGRGSSAAGPVHLYGPSEEDPQLGIAPFPDWEPSTSTSDEKPIHLEDRTIYPFDGMGFGKQVLIVQPEGQQAAVLVSQGLDADQLQELATVLAIGDDGSVDLGGYDLPGGWREVGTVPDLLGLASPFSSTRASSVGNYVMYQRGGTGTVESTDSGSNGGSEPATTTTTEPAAPDELPGTIFVSSTPRDEAGLHATALVADETSTVEVRGHEALLTESNVSALGTDVVSRTVAWLERPGEMIGISSTGLDADELLAVAEGVEPVPPAEWKDLLERSQLGEFDPANASDPPTTTIGSGRFADGTKWVVGYRVDGTGDEQSVTVDLAVASRSTGDTSSSSFSGSGSGLGPDGGAIISTEVEDEQDRSYGAAIVSADVARVELRDARGTVLATPDIVEGGGQRAIAVEVPDAAAVLVALDAQGNELSSIEFVRTPPSQDSGGFSSGGSSSGGSSSGESTATTVAEGSATTVTGG